MNNIDSSEILDDQVLDRTAKQLLARTQPDWTARHARQLTGNSLRRTDSLMQKDHFNSLVSSVYRVGQHIPVTRNLFKSVPYDWESLRKKLCSALDCETRHSLDEAVFSELCSYIGGYSYETTRYVDWVEKVNNALAVNRKTSLDPSLEQKLLAANHIDSFLEERLISLAATASEAQDISLSECISAITQAFSSRPPRALSRPIPSTSPTNDSKRLSPDELTQIERDVEFRLQEAFISTLQAASPRVQRCLFNKWITLKKNPIAGVLWTKKIEGTECQIRELKFVADGSHFRLLYSISTGRILTFGLRRDLRTLILKAKQ